MNKDYQVRCQVRIKVSNGQFFADGFAVREYFELKEQRSRVISFLSPQGCGAATLSLQGGKVRMESGKVGLIEWANGAELFPVAGYGEGKSETRNFSHNGKSIAVRCVSGTPSEVVFLGETRQKFALLCPVYEPEVTLLSGQREAVLNLRARCEKGEYIALFSAGTSGAKLLMEACGEEVICEGNEVTIHTLLSDLLGRKVTSRYLWNGDGFTCSREIVCTKEHTFLREEATRLLLEAVFARDKERLNALLAPAVRDARAVLDYFGVIKEVRPAFFANSPTAMGVVRQEGERLIATAYDVDLNEEGLIENIRCLDDES
ncbi:MAG TPA: hypothetical protein DIC18_00175 [Clostridiales bacterium]|nr:hypothetical protein [Clostridiales bacterium]